MSTRLRALPLTSLHLIAARACAHTDGLGYVLTIVRHARRGGEDESMNALGKLVMSHVPDAHPLTRAGDEESYRLPGGATAAFSALLRALDGSPVVRTYGMQITTLEEVFIHSASRD